MSINPDKIKLTLAFPEAGDKYTREELAKAFDKVKNHEHWKNPINSWVHESELDVTLEAIKYFSATEGTVVEVKGARLLVEADGYYMGPAGP